MTTRTQRQTALKQALQQRSLVKVIAGIDNTDLDRVSQVVQAATQTNAGSVDVAATETVVRLTRQLTDLPVFASSVTPEALAQAVENGADAVEIGNFDALYAQGFYLGAQDVIELTEKTLALLPTDTLLSVTIPGHLSLEAQISLAQKLEAMGVDMLQTEGASSVVTITREVQLLSTADKVALTLRNTHALSQAVSIPIITASGMSAETVSAALENGASAIGVGTAVNRLAQTSEMVTVLEEVMTAVTRFATRQAVHAS